MAIRRGLSTSVPDSTDSYSLAQSIVIPCSPDSPIGADGLNVKAGIGEGRHLVSSSKIWR